MAANRQAATDELRSAVEACDREAEHGPLPFARIAECDQDRTILTDRGPVAAD